MNQAVREHAVASREPIRSERLMAEVRVGMNVPLALISGLLVSTIVLYPVGNALFGLGSYLGARKMTRQVGEAAGQFLRDFIGSEPRFMDAWCGGYGANLGSVTGTGIAYAEGRLYVLEEGTAAEIPWSQVRSWSWEIQGWETVASGGDHAPDTPMCLVHKAQKPRIIAHRASGFTIVTRDVEKTEWRFTTIDKAVCAKWMEILRQMSEGELPAR